MTRRGPWLFVACRSRGRCMREVVCPRGPGSGRAGVASPRRGPRPPGRRHDSTVRVRAPEWESRMRDGRILSSLEGVR
eukprot:3564362-Prymnesium_polylepis.1